jgi:hypothetical protein
MSELSHTKPLNSDSREGHWRAERSSFLAAANWDSAAIVRQQGTSESHRFAHKLVDLELSING